VGINLNPDRGDVEEPTDPVHGNLIKLLYHIFHRYFCKEEGIPNARKPEVMPAVLMGWVYRWFTLGQPIDLDAVCKTAGVPPEVWDVLVKFVEDPLAPERLRFAWPQITMGNRSAPKHKISRIMWNLILEFDDGHITPVQVMLPVELTDRGSFDDGLLGSILQSRVDVFYGMVVEEGIDGLYERGGDYGGEHPFNVLMGATLKIMPQLDPVLHTHLKSYMRLCQGLIQPPIPVAMKAEMEARKSARGQSVTVPPTGGWDS
jgi:hypothetical protein